MSEQMCIHAIVSGTVQGVYLRSNTRKKANTLNLTGWVKNLENGTVEVVACGSKKEVLALTEWLWEGPKQAEVSHVHWEETPLEKHEAFLVL